jgi:hypothetical protein
MKIIQTIPKTVMLLVFLLIASAPLMAQPNDSIYKRGELPPNPDGMDFTTDPSKAQNEDGKVKEIPGDWVVYVQRTYDEKAFKDKLSKIAKEYDVDAMWFEVTRKRCLDKIKLIENKLKVCKEKGPGTETLSFIDDKSRVTLENYYVCRKLAQGDQACAPLRGISQTGYNKCVNEKSSMWFSIMPAAMKENATTEEFTKSAAEICAGLPMKEQVSNCSAVVALMLKTLNTALLVKDRQKCSTIEEAPYRKFCEALIDGKANFCGSPESKHNGEEMHLCLDQRNFERFAAIASGEMETLQLKLIREGDLENLLASYYIVPSACEDYLGGPVGDICDAAKYSYFQNVEIETPESASQQ